jgi:hypothetical protein
MEIGIHEGMTKMALHWAKAPMSDNFGCLLANEQVGGLHHRYTRRAA